jgi:hypothetical protein
MGFSSPATLLRKVIGLKTFNFSRIFGVFSLEMLEYSQLISGDETWKVPSKGQEVQHLKYGGGLHEFKLFMGSPYRFHSNSLRRG